MADGGARRDASEGEGAQWYRSTVHSITHGGYVNAQYGVRFVGYGNTATVTRDQIRPIHSNARRRSCIRSRSCL